MILRPYFIVPKLIPQPTWGGDYIGNFKGITDPRVTSVAIGQSYELSSDSMLSSSTDSRTVPIELGDPKNGKTTATLGTVEDLFSLQSLIEQNSEDVLGTHAVQVHGNRMHVLIKFTQAKGNSFQVHVIPGKEFAHWKSKPESWYYFEPGKATVGLKNPTPERLAAYKNACVTIANLAERLQSDVASKSMSVEEAKQLLQAQISVENPLQYVNEVPTETGTIIDLSSGGIHHSWEEGDSIPLGNVVYEVQVNVMDNECTIRSYDKGKIGADGTVRPVHVEDYFLALDTDLSHNDVSSTIQLPTSTEVNGATQSNLFTTPYYSSKEVTFTGTYHEDSSSSFHHLFVKEGSIQCSSGDVTLVAHKGSSVFIPAAVDYSLVSPSAATVIITSV